MPHDWSGTNSKQDCDSTGICCWLAPSPDSRMSLDVTLPLMRLSQPDRNADLVQTRHSFSQCAEWNHGACPVWSSSNPAAGMSTTFHCFSHWPRGEVSLTTTCCFWSVGTNWPVTIDSHQWICTFGNWNKKSIHCLLPILTDGPTFSRPLPDVRPFCHQFRKPQRFALKVCRFFSQSNRRVCARCRVTYCSDRRWVSNRQVASIKLANSICLWDTNVIFLFSF